MGKVQFDPRITWGNILTLLTVVAGGLTFLFSMQTADAVISQRLSHLEEKAKRFDADRDLIAEIRADVKVLLRANSERQK